MSFYEDLGKGQPKEVAPAFVIIEGSFGCDRCWEICDEAEYYRSDKRLVFRHDDHENVIEGFVI